MSNRNPYDETPPDDMAFELRWCMLETLDAAMSARAEGTADAERVAYAARRRLEYARARMSRIDSGLMLWRELVYPPPPETDL